MAGGLHSMKNGVYIITAHTSLFFINLVCECFFRECIYLFRFFSFLQNIVDSLEQKFNSLLHDDEEDINQPEFLVPELPKPKKEMNGKRKSRGLYNRFCVMHFNL